MTAADSAKTFLQFVNMPGNDLPVTFEADAIQAFIATPGTARWDHFLFASAPAEQPSVGSCCGRFGRPGRKLCTARHGAAIAGAAQRTSTEIPLVAVMAAAHKGRATPRRVTCLPLYRDVPARNGAPIDYRRRRAGGRYVEFVSFIRYVIRAFSVS